ncbi:putative amidoligase enzyme domain-containing protein [Hirsutella rhossiliensis]|uniref:Amidoligase enzyme domain-containing protein n=1 Tax=Hirsutella rhossiliensis TaxID=111463 RepID=A0A9P8MSU8_9HYPO|nr:putative amidoligase enzyme domain-containing protein [Hirsutella rhossiliensis]KAH0958557.1 putative amidoligase enzyme domain-containing protein [Hirsutella rhossiliensis]
MPSDPDASESSNHKQIDLSSSSRLLVWNPERGGTDGTEARFNYWLVTYDGSVTDAIVKRRIKTPGLHDWHTIEINSQIISDQAELDEGLPTVKKALASIQNNVKVWLNDECGFHVHVSPLRGKLDIAVTRRMAALVLLMERRFLLKLCHPCRQNSPHTRPISTDSVFAVNASASPEAPLASSLEGNLLGTFRAKARGRSSDEPSIFRMLCAIFSTADIKSIGRGLRLPRIGSGSLLDGNRGAIAVSTYDTVEMRYPEASFDVEFLSLWVDLSRRVFAFASAPDDEYGKKLLEFYDMATADIELGWIHWLKAVGLDERADFCKKHINRYRVDLKDLNKRGILPKVKS